MDEKERGREALSPPAQRERVGRKALGSSLRLPNFFPSPRPGPYLTPAPGVFPQPPPPTPTPAAGQGSGGLSRVPQNAGLAGSDPAALSGGSGSQTRPREGGRGVRGVAGKGPISARGCGRAAIGRPRGLQPPRPLSVL